MRRFHAAPASSALVLGSAVGLALAGASCDPASDVYFGYVREPDPAHLTICNWGEPETFDPGLASSAPDLKIVYELFDGLTTFDAQALPIPSLATSWDVSSDLTRFTFHLRPDARWSNGRLLVADDFVYSFARVLHPLTASMNADAMLRLRHAKEYNAGTARLVLADAAPFRAGQVVVAVDDDAAADARGGPNARTARRPTPLRAEPAPDAAVWADLPAGAELTVIDRRCSAGACWAYVYSSLSSLGGEGVYGWVPFAELAAPNDGRAYRVKAIDGATAGNVLGRDLLMLPELLGVSAPDPHTLVVETDGPTPYFVDLTLQRQFRPVPREVASRWPRTWTAPSHFVGSGPFLLAAHRPRDKIELARAPTFWDAAHVRLARVTFLSIESQAVATSIYYQGGCDALVANAMPLSYLPAVAGKLDFRIAPYLGVNFLLVNTRRFPNLHFRRALAMSLDRDQFMRLIGWGDFGAEEFVPGTRAAELTPEERALCKLAPGDRRVALIVAKGVCYVPPKAPGFDVEGARRELALARAELGDRTPSRVSFLYNSGMPQHKMLAEWVQAEWKKNLGVDVTIETQDWRSMLTSTAEGRYDVARLAWIGSFPDPESEYVNIFKCGTPTNRTGFCDPEVDRLLAEAAAEPDRARRLDRVREAEARVVEQAPIIPLYRSAQDHLQKPYVRDLFINLLDHQSLRATWIDPDWRKR